MPQPQITPFSVPVEAIETVLASDGVKLPISSLPQVFGYTGSLISTITVTFGGVIYVQTLSYDGSNNLTGVSAWVKQ